MQTTTPPLTTPAPRKSRKRWYLIGGFLLLLAFTPFAFFLIAGWWNERVLAEIYRDIDAEDPNWRWPDLAVEFKPPPDEQNSALQIRKAHALLKAIPFNPGPKWDIVSDQLYRRNARLTPQQAELLRVAFKKLDPKLLEESRKIKELATGGIAMKPVENTFFDLKLDLVQESREVAYLLQCDAIWRGHQGDHDGALESCQAIVNVGRSLKDQPFLISQLVRMAIQAIATGALERTLGQGVVDERGLAKMQTLLEMETVDDALHQAMRGERAGGQQIYELLREGKLSMSQLTSGMRMSPTPNPADRVLDLFPGLILGSYPDYLRTMTEQVRASKLTDVERAEAMQRLVDKGRKNRSLLSSMIMPAAIKGAVAAQRSQAYLRCAGVALAAERYRIQKNQWPVSLADLVKAGLLKKIPDDPYDGQALRMKRTPTGLIVYSVGPDKADDGGTLNRKNPSAPKTDLGFELWEPRLRGVAPVVDGNEK